MEGAKAACSFLKPNLVIEYTRTGNIAGIEKVGKDEGDKISQPFEKAAKALMSREFDIIILNGIHQMVNLGLIPHDQIMELMRKKPDHVELVLTGPGAGEELIERAHLVTEMIYHTGRQGLENNSDLKLAAPTEVVTGNTARAKLPTALERRCSCRAWISAPLFFSLSNPPGPMER
jgi:hypothetical protein